MLDSPFTEAHDIYRRQVRAWVEKELIPNAERFEAEEHTPRAIFEQAGELGFLGARFPERCGGSGGDFWYTVAWVEELARSNLAGTCMGLMVQSDMATPVIADLGTEEQIETFLAPAIRGEKIAALGVTEPGAGSDVASIRTTARKDGDDFIIDGAKTYITNGTQADFITLAVRTDPYADPGWTGISLVLFPTDTPGFSVGKKLKKLGNHSSDTAELHFDGCRIPRRYLLGEEGHGFVYIMRNFQGERLVGALSAIAGAKQILDRSIQYGKERQAFGRPIIKFQVWRHAFVDMLTEVEAGRLLAYKAAHKFAAGEDATLEISQAKLYCGELANKVADRCLQFHGGMGYMEEYFIARAWRDLRLITIGGGTSEVMKEIISKYTGI
jgi:citronellyl-CoA dehydrogenase